MNYGDTQQSLKSDIAEHLNKKEANEADVAEFQEFLKESASEGMVDELFNNLYVGNEKEFFKLLVKGFGEYRDDQ